MLFSIRIVSMFRWAMNTVSPKTVHHAVSVIVAITPLWVRTAQSPVIRHWAFTLWKGIFRSLSTCLMIVISFYQRGIYIWATCLVYVKFVFLLLDLQALHGTHDVLIIVRIAMYESFLSQQFFLFSCTLRKFKWCTNWLFCFLVLLFTI